MSSPTQTKSLKTQQLLLIFLLSMPIFFGFIVLGLYFIETEEWVEGVARVKAEQEVRLYSPADAHLMSIQVGEGDMVKKGQLLALFHSDALERQIQVTANRRNHLAGDIALQKTRQKLLEISPVDEDLEKAEITGQTLEKKIALFNQRRKVFLESVKRGSYSKLELEDLELEIISLEQQKKNNDLLLKKLSKGLVELRLLEAKQSLALLVSDDEALAKEEKLYRAMKQSLNILAPFDGKIVRSNLKYPGEHVPAGKWLFSLTGSEKKKLEIRLNEKHVIDVHVGQKVLFESAVFSVYEYDYYEGKVKRISPMTALESGGGEKVYLIESNLENRSNSRDILELPFDSTGTGSISIGRKNLLFQLIGWK